MKTFVFSDTHLTTKFDQQLYNKLEELIKRSDKVVINGDFWDGLIVTFNEFMNSKWSALFPLLKEKKAIYIYGNHDNAHMSDDRVYQFCDHALTHYELNTPNRTYYFVHGDKFLYPKQPLDTILEGPINPLKERFMGYSQYWILKIMGPHAFPKRFNDLTINEREQIVGINKMLVCGHSHKQQYNEKLNFADLGFFNYNWANYMLIDEKGNFTLYSEKY